MTPAVETPTPAQTPLVRQLTAWVEARPRTYAEAVDAWRTSCPRLSIWEDALSAGLIEVTSVAGAGLQGAAVRVTPQGAALLRAEAAQ